MTGLTGKTGIVGFPSPHPLVNPLEERWTYLND